MHGVCEVQTQEVCDREIQHTNLETFVDAYAYRDSVTDHLI
jgi:hypothetical protein